MTWKFDLVAGPFKGRTGGLAWDGSGMLCSLVLEERIVKFDPKTGKEVRYAFDGVLEVSGAPVPSPATAQFNPHSLQRVQVVGNELERMLDQLDRSGARFVSAGTGAKIRPQSRNR